MQHLPDHASPTAERVVRTGRSPWVHGSLAVVLWLAAAAASGATGPAVTPRILAAIAAATESRSIPANLALAESNAHLAAKIAAALLS